MILVNLYLGSFQEWNASHGDIFSGEIEVCVQVHVDHWIRLVPWNQRMGWLVNHSNLFEVDPASENLARTIQIRSVADSDHRDFTGGADIFAPPLSSLPLPIFTYLSPPLPYHGPAVWLQSSLRPCSCSSRTTSTHA